MKALGMMPSATYREVGFVGGDLQFMFWGLAFLVVLFCIYRLNAMSERLFPNRPSIGRTTRFMIISTTVLLIIGSLLGNNSRAIHLAANIDTKYKNLHISSDELTPLMDIYNKGKGDRLVVGGYSGNYYIVANGSNEPTVLLIPGSDLPEPELNEPPK